jgi:transposase
VARVLVCGSAGSQQLHLRGSHAYAEATRDQQLEAWIQAHIRALEFFDGVPTLAVPDNAKTAVTRACRYDPDLNPTYQDFAVHYGRA